MNAGSLSQKLVNSMVDLLTVGLEEAELATLAEIEGSCGPAQVTAAEATPAAAQQAAILLQAEALAAASQVCSLHWS